MCVQYEEKTVKTLCFSLYFVTLCLIIDYLLKLCINHLISDIYEMYKAYHELGGNGMITHMKEDIEKLHMGKDE